MGYGLLWVRAGGGRVVRGAVSLGLFLVLSVFLTGCGEENTYVAPPPPKVTVATPLIEEVTDYLTFTGSTAADAYAEIPARVSGILLAQHFEPGASVEAGALLFTIEPEPYEADVAVAEAQLAQARARKVEADKALERAKKLLSRGNVSQATFDEAEAAALSAAADVKQAQARLKQANIDLSYTKITAPFAGRVGRALVDVGNLVGGSNGVTILTDITTFDPINVYFTLNERDLLRVLDRFRADAEARGETFETRPMTPLELGLADDPGYPHAGVVDFASSAVDPGTGTLELRGVFPNSGDIPEILPGMFARIRMPFGIRDGLALVSDRAVSADQRGSFVLIVGEGNTVERRPVQTGVLIDGLRVIENGLAPGDKVIVNGIQKARPGSVVAPEETEMSSLRLSARTGN